MDHERSPLFIKTLADCISHQSLSSSVLTLKQDLMLGNNKVGGNLAPSILPLKFAESSLHFFSKRLFFLSSLRENTKRSVHEGRLLPTIVAPLGNFYDVAHNMGGATNSRVSLYRDFSHEFLENVDAN